MSYRNLKTIPVYGKSLELYQMSKEIASFITFNKDLLKRYQSKSLRDSIADAILTDAILITQQIAQAERTNIHATRMRSASYIGIMIRNINSYCTGLEKDGIKEIEYINLLRKEVRTFRGYFKQWRLSLSGEM